MNILAIESSTTVCGVSLFLDNKLIELEEINKPFIHGKKLPVFIDNIIRNNSLSLSELDAIAVSSGPGSYTGLRIGMSIARGLSASRVIPMIPVPTLLAMNNCIRKKGLYWIAIHSHKNMIYAQRFHSGEPVSEIIFDDYKSVKNQLIYGFNLENLYEKYNSISPSAKYVGEIALKNYNEWLETDINKVFPNYITNFNLGKPKII